MTPYEFYMLRRGVLKLTQVALADELGKSASTVGRYENGEVDIPFLVAKVVIAMAKEAKARPSTTAPASPSSPGPPADSDVSDE